MNEHIIEMSDEIGSLSIGSSAIIKKNTNGRTESVIIVKDSIGRVMSLYQDINVECRCGLINSNNVISCHVIIKISSYAYLNYYSFYFNYFNEESLLMIISLMYQKKLYLVLCSENDQCMELAFKNKLRKFFKHYINRVLKSGLRWNDEQYKSSIQKIVLSYGDIEECWNSLGESIELEEITS